MRVKIKKAKPPKGLPNCKCFSAAKIEVIGVCPCNAVYKDKEDGEWKYLRPGERMIVNRSGPFPVLRRLTK